MDGRERAETRVELLWKPSRVHARLKSLRNAPLAIYLLAKVNARCTFLGKL